MAASGSEVARHDKSVSRSFAEGFERSARAIEAVVEDASLSATARERALLIAVGEITRLS